MAEMVTALGRLGRANERLTVVSRRSRSGSPASLERARISPSAASWWAQLTHIAERPLGLHACEVGGEEVDAVPVESPRARS
jgi:hypothetical protein